MIPVVIVHEDYNNFLKSSIEITGKNNKIYLKVIEIKIETNNLEIILLEGSGIFIILQP